jgi:hypothetical protein
MTTYPNSAYTPVMDLYKTLPAELKPKAQKVLGGFAKRYKQGEAPPDEMLHSLEALTHSSTDDLEVKTHAAHAEMTAPKTSLSPRFKAGLGLAAILAGVALLSGMPYMPPPLY